MPRPQKSRRICCYPDYWSFAPDQVTANATIVMSLDEFETIRLIDYVRLIDGDVQLDEELFLFSGITGRRCYPQGNLKLSCIKTVLKFQMISYMNNASS